MMVPTTKDRAGVTAVVHEVISAILPGVPRHEIVGEKHLRDLGADSVDRVEIVLSLMRRFGIDQPMSSFNDLPHVDALVDFLVRTERR